jgi:hypothetical protein
MERELWVLLYHLAVRLDTRANDYRGSFVDAWIVAVYLWAVVHDRPVSWACRQFNWSTPHLRLPSTATMSRRLRTSSVRSLLDRMYERLAAWHTASQVAVIDAKPLCVGQFSKDPDARWGYSRYGKQRGYKLFAVIDGSQLPRVFCVEPMNVGEPTVGKRLVPQLPEGGYLLADCGYDSNELFDVVGQRHKQLLTAKKKAGSGLGHRHQSPYRLRSIELLGTAAGRALYRGRAGIERQFGWLTTFGGGLAPLPAWVRRLPRVRRWVLAKWLIHAVYRQTQTHSKLKPLTANKIC